MSILGRVSGPALVVGNKNGDARLTQIPCVMQTCRLLPCPPRACSSFDIGQFAARGLAVCTPNPRASVGILGGRSNNRPGCS